MSNVSFEVFVEKFCETLELVGTNLATSSLKDVSELDSMGKINISLLIEDLFNFQIEYDVLDSQKTLTSLYQYCLSQVADTL